MSRSACIFHLEGDTGSTRDLASLAEADSLFAADAADRLKRLRAELEPLQRRYDVVIANPPYMGSSSLGKWMGAWVKERFPEAYRDLCTCFIDRGFSLSAGCGYSAMVTMQSWMFLGSFEKLRGKILRNHTISSMAHLGTRAFGAIAGEVVSTTATVFANQKSDVPGTYLRLVDMGSEQEKAAGALEALANPDCEWLYRISTDSFQRIPGTPIAYWVKPGMAKAFALESLARVATARTGMATGRNDYYLRNWHEVSFRHIGFNLNRESAKSSSIKWFPYNKGGAFRKWYGNRDYVVNWYKDGEELQNTLHPDGKRIWAHNFNLDKIFKPCISWSDISVGRLSFRYFEQGFLFDSSGTACFPDSEDTMFELLAYLNTNQVEEASRILNPTIHFTPGDCLNLPFRDNANKRIDSIVQANINMTKCDWDQFESSWEFKRHPLV